MSIKKAIKRAGLLGVAVSIAGTIFGGIKATETVQGWIKQRDDRIAFETEQRMRLNNRLNTFDEDICELRDQIARVRDPASGFKWWEGGCEIDDDL